TGVDGLVFVTENGGRAWKRKYVERTQIFGADFVNFDEGYVFGRGVLYKAVGGLETFKKIDLGDELSYGWIYRVKRSIGVGRGGHVYKLHGEKWTKERVTYNKKGDH
ncbi:MAG: hypothetical protein WAV13_12180, partial [Thermodesulfovibrionales bacterium]